MYYKRNQRGHDGYVIEYDGRPSEAPSLLQTLKRYILRSKVKVEDVSAQYDVWASWGSERSSSSQQWTHTRSGIIEPVWSTELTESPWSDGVIDSLRLRDRRAPGMGSRLITGKGDKRMSFLYNSMSTLIQSRISLIAGEASTHDLASHDDYTLHRVLHGVPEGTTDIVPMHAFPMESNLDIMGGRESPLRTPFTFITTRQI